ncbi:hypothetical protein BH09MYX1_BH09MYX1_20880 [soil metagenome]
MINDLSCKLHQVEVTRRRGWAIKARPMVRSLALAFAVSACTSVLLSALSAGCAKDVVLPAESTEAVCGDGILASTEECDGTFPGCNACRIIPGWDCEANACHPLCGDGIVGDGELCDNARKLEPCDLNGYWAVRETSFTRDSVLGEIQTSSGWYLFHISQTGDAFQIEEALGCGVRVTGSATVEDTTASLRALVYKNDMGTTGKHGPRRGTFKPEGNGCAFSLDRFYQARCVVDALLPSDFLAKPDLSALPQMPEEPNPLDPTGQSLNGADEPDGDGIPGYSLRISGIATGIRNAAQRDFTEFATKSGTPTTKNAITFVAPCNFDLQESILRVSDCGLSCGLIASKAFVAKEKTPRTTFRFVGHTLDGPTAKAIIKGPLHADTSVDLATCGNVRSALPHDPAKD